MAAAPPPALARVPGRGVAAAYFTAGFLAHADLDTMRDAAAAVPAAAGGEEQHVAVEWSCLAGGPVDLVNALTLLYSTRRAIKVLYITVPKLASGNEAAAATGLAPPSLCPATRFQNLVYDNRDVHWSVVGKLIHAALKRDAFWINASTAYKMNRLATVKERPALPAVEIVSIGKTRSELQAAVPPLPRLSKKAMKRLQPARVKADLADLAAPTWQPPPMPPPSLIPDVHDAESTVWV